MRPHLAMVAAVAAALAATSATGGGEVVVDHNPILPAGPVFTPPGAGGWAGSNPVRRGQESGTWAAEWLRRAAAYCDALPDDDYQIDCLAERFGYIAAQMDGSGAYAETRAALARASRDLAAMARRYRDTSRTAKVFATPPGAARPQRSTRPVVPVRPDARAESVAAARAIIAETETVLLRSSEANPSVGPQIQLISAAVGSNKALLRST